MTEVFLEFSGANAKAQREGILTSGMVGVPVHLAFDSAWDGLSITLVFEGSGVTKDVVLNGETECILPWEVLVQSGTKVKAGAEGRDVNGELVLPSVMTVIGKTFLGADPEGDESTDPTLPVWAQIQSTIGDLSKLETTKKDTLVNAINSANRSGGGGGGGGGNTSISEKEYVLIETITLTEATTFIERTQEPNGTPYNFKDVFLEITGGDTSTNGWLIWEVFYGSQSLRIFRDLNIFDTNNIFLSSRSHGNLRELWFGNSNTNYDHAALPWNVNNRFLLSWENITKMTFQHQTAMPVGTKIIIYAARG